MTAAGLALAPMTNRGVYPSTEWGASAFDYYRATVSASVELLLSHLTERLASQGLAVTRERGAAVRYYSSHCALTDRLGHVIASVYWGGSNLHPNVEAKGSRAPVVADALRSLCPHRPSRVDVKRDATAPDLFPAVRSVAAGVADRWNLSLQDVSNNHPDRGDTVYLGSRQSQSFLRIYQPGLKRAAEEGRSGGQIADEDRNAVRVEHEFKPQKRRAKLAASSLSPDALWGVSPWLADFAAECFAMTVQPISIAERRESNRNRALRFMAMQYRAHLADLLRECQGDLSAFGSTIADLADLR